MAVPTFSKVRTIKTVYTSANFSVSFTEVKHHIKDMCGFYEC